MTASHTHLPAPGIGLGLLLVAALQLGCGPIEVKIPSETTITMPGTGIGIGNPLLPDQIFPTDVFSEALAQAINQSFDTGGYDKSKVSSLTLSLMTLTVTEPNDGDVQVRGLGFLDALTVYLGEPDADPIEVAHSADGAFDGTPGPVDYIMELTNNDVASAFKAASSLEMTADVQPSEPPRFDTDVLFNVELTVQIDPFASGA